MNARQLASLLEYFDVRPRQFRDGVRKERGYRRDQLRDLVARYVPEFLPHEGKTLRCRPRSGTTVQHQKKSRILRDRSRYRHGTEPVRK